MNYRDYVQHTQETADAWQEYKPLVTTHYPSLLDFMAGYNARRAQEPAMVEEARGAGYVGGYNEGFIDGRKLGMSEARQIRDYVYKKGFDDGVSDSARGYAEGFVDGSNSRGYPDVYSAISELTSFDEHKAAIEHLVYRLTADEVARAHERVGEIMRAKREIELRAIAQRAAQDAECDNCGDSGVTITFIVVPDYEGDLC